MLSKTKPLMRSSVVRMMPRVLSTNPLYPSSPSPLQEFSVVYTDRAINHMSNPFMQAMNDINNELKEVYNAANVVVIPGSGTYGMEACARAFSLNQKSIVLRNGFFSFRWTQIFEACDINTEAIVLRAECTARATCKDPACAEKCEGAKAQYAPHALSKVLKTIAEEKPAVVYAPHVETSTGILLPDDYIKQVAAAVHAEGGLFVLDGVASGTVWVDMKALGVDAYITAPQKGWTGPACAGLVMLSERGTEAVRAGTGNSFTVNLKKWLEVMDAYEKGGFTYYTTMPTDALMTFRDVIKETKEFGYDRAKSAAFELGEKVHNLLCKDHGLTRVAAPGYEAPGVVVVHTEDATVAGKFNKAGTQIAAGVPFMIGEAEATKTFRIGLFGLDKLRDTQLTADTLKGSLKEVL